MVMLATALVALMQSDAKDEALGAGKKLAESKNYSWKGSSKFEGDLPFGGNQGQAMPEIKVEGSHVDGTGTRILTETSEYIKVGDKTVTRPRGEWRVVEENAGDGFRGGGRGMGRMFGGFGGVPKAPHDDFKNLDTKITDIAKAEAKEKIGETECTVYSGKLQDDAAKEGLPFGRMLERMGDATVTGTFKYWVDGEGNLVKFQYSTKVAASFQGNDFEFTFVRAVEISDVGKAKVEIPDDAKKALEGKKPSD
jgi:hypothetical protein